MAKLSALAEKYGWKVLGGALGEGGQAQVVPVERVTEPGGKRYAFKLLSKKGGPKALERFRAELAALAKLDHPGIVKVVDYPQDFEEQPFYVMEYVEGAKSLRQRMSQGTNPYYRDALRSIDGFIQLVEALAECEKARVVHRDLSPANVLVTEDGRVMLIDFGLCHAGEGARVTLTDEAVGTPHYRPPECSGHSTQPVTIRADLYSAGKILWSMVTNQMAFDREAPVFNVQLLPNKLPDDRMTWHFHHVFQNTIREEPGARFDSAAALLGTAKLVRRLIVEGYMPLESLAVGVCPVCGLSPNPMYSSYLKYGKHMDDYVAKANLPPGRFSICQFCFHIRFVVGDALAQSLEDRKKLR